MVDFLKTWSQLAGLGATEIMLSQLVQYVAAGFMIFGGVVPYIPQYLDIRRSKNSEGFSTFVCLTLLVANILRILFWFGHRFELPLLAQSIVMIITMFIMVHLCTAVKARSEIIASKPRTFSDLDTEYFWRWSDFPSYVEFMSVFTGVSAALTYFLLDNQPYIETLGFLAVFFEALLGAPQLYRNFQNKSTQGMSVKMVLMWTSGDVFKTAYFLLRNSPMQFWICGSLQVSLDVAILSQVWFYGRRKPAVQ